MSGFGEEQPALDENAEKMRDDADNEDDLRGQPASDRHANSSARMGKIAPKTKRDHPKLCGVFAGNAKAHFSGQIVVKRMRPLEQPHLADESKAGRSFQASRSGQACVARLRQTILAVKRQKHKQQRQQLHDQRVSTREGACEQKSTRQ